MNTNRASEMHRPHAATMRATRAWPDAPTCRQPACLRARQVVTAEAEETP
jgi:hypothetical protein